MFINIHTHHSSKQTDVIEIVDLPLNASGAEQPSTYCSIGIHPWTADNTLNIKALQKRASDRRVLTIGECGLDKSKGPALTIQTELFIKQVELSEQLRKPLIIHCVRAYSEIIKLRKDTQPSQAWIFHGFNASRETMEQALNQDFYFSIGEAILKKNSKVRQTLPFIPHNRLFLETDDNPQLRIESIYEKSAQLLNLELTQLQGIIQDNFKQLFNVDNRFH